MFFLLKHGLKKVAYTSSIGVYGPDHAEFPEPTTHYGSFKLASEGVARSFYEEHGISSQKYSDPYPLVSEYVYGHNSKMAPHLNDKLSFLFTLDSVADLKSVSGN